MAWRDRRFSINAVSIDSSVGGTRIFWGHGTQDQAIPHRHAVAGREALRAAGADLVAKDYPMGHSIGQEELYDASAWVEATVAGTPGSR